MTEAADTTETLLFETSPFGNLDAIVERDDRVVYFYLSGDEAFGKRACWVRNLVAGPWLLNTEELAQGIPPLLPRIHCVRTEPGLVPAEKDLSIVWFAEGNGAALFERNELLAVIPPWSGQEGFHGYSRDCASENLICSPLPDAPELRLRIQQSADFWQACTDGSAFREIQTRQIELYQTRFGPMREYFAIDGNRFPPRGMGLFQGPDVTVLATVGNSLCPQPMVEFHLTNPRDFRRFELALELNPDWSGEKVQQAAGRLGGLAGMPWRVWDWLVPNHTCDFAFDIARQRGVIHTDVDWQRRSLNAVRRDWHLPTAFGDPVNLWWIVPLEEQGNQKVCEQGQPPVVKT